MDDKESTPEKMKDSALEVPRQVFEEFLSQLGDIDVPKDVITRLRKVILEEAKINQETLWEAIFPEN